MGFRSGPEDTVLNRYWLSSLYRAAGSAAKRSAHSERSILKPKARAASVSGASPGLKTNCTLG